MGDGEHAQATTRSGIIGSHDLGAIGIFEGMHVSVQEVVGTQCQDLLRSSLHIGNGRDVWRRVSLMEGTHALAARVEGKLEQTR